jgi:hypothetical protein
MNAALKLEVRMSIEERVVKIESDIGHAPSTLAEVKNDIRSLRGDRSLRDEIKELRTEFRTFELETVKKLASVSK